MRMLIYAIEFYFANCIIDYVEKYVGLLRNVVPVLR